MVKEDYGVESSRDKINETQVIQLQKLRGDVPEDPIEKM